jgi:uncharacterized protein (TIGR02266 family)
MVLEVRYRNEGQFLVSYCTNLSRGGLFIPTSNPEPVGTTILLSLKVPGRAVPVSMSAIVRWNRPDETSEGPAGMGLSFADIDAMLGEHIDRLVSRAPPIKIDLVGRSDHAGAHLHALLRSLITCETRTLALRPGVESAIGQADLVVVDVDGHPRNGLALLESLHHREEKVPAVALCAERDAELRTRAGRYASVVSTPVDKRELQRRVLETLGQVQFVRTVVPEH